MHWGIYPDRWRDIELHRATSRQRDAYPRGVAMLPQVLYGAVTCLPDVTDS